MSSLETTAHAATHTARRLIIAIDGPSGAGKSTIGRLLARRLGLLYLDTGAMYRAAALRVIESNVRLQDETRVAEICHAAHIELEGDPDAIKVNLDGRDVTHEIRTEQVGHAASVISTNSQVRRDMVRRQRELARSGGIVLDGRDIGTVVFPDADAKFFLTATPEQRAERRFEQDTHRGADANFEDVLRDINMRDERDANRDDSPLRIADDAVVLDSTEATIDEVLGKMIAVVLERQNEKAI